MTAKFILYPALGLVLLGICDFANALVSHRAHYKISLVSKERDSKVVGAEGTMVLEMRNMCDGWSVEQKSDTTLFLNASDDENLSSHYVAWESMDGDKLRFFTSRSRNGMLFEDVNGEAEFNLEGGEGKISFNTPESISLAVKPGTIPPIKHLLSLLKAAGSGQEMVSNEVFDGSSFSDAVQINTFITKQKKQCGKEKHVKGLKGPVYPMQLAVYATASLNALPSFEISQKFYKNGVMCSYTVNFGDYKVAGTIDRVEYLPQKPCKK